jgi:hypothetical protein
LLLARFVLDCQSTGFEFRLDLFHRVCGPLHSLVFQTYDSPIVHTYHLGEMFPIIFDFSDQFFSCGEMEAWFSIA